MESDAEDLEIDLKYRLGVYLPMLSEFLSVQDFKPEQWDKLNSNFHERHLERKKEYLSNDNHLQVSANIYDIITEKLKGNLNGVKYLEFITKTLEELSDHLSDSGKKAINKTIYDFLISYDHRFRNYLGELLVLNSVIKGNIFSLETVESHIVNNQTADFLFSRKDGRGHQLVEVVNLHITGEHTMLETYLPKSFSRKLAKKTDGETVYAEFILIPVIWAAPVDLLRVLDTWKTMDKTDLKNVCEPVSYLCLTSAEHQVFYKFGTLSTLLEGMDLHI